MAAIIELRKKKETIPEHSALYMDMGASIGCCWAMTEALRRNCFEYVGEQDQARAAISHMEGVGLHVRSFRATAPLNEKPLPAIPFCPWCKRVVKVRVVHHEQ